MATDLGKFEGKPVRRASISIRNTGDGLSDALKLEPEIIHGGEKRYVVLEVDVEKIRHDPMDDGDAWDRVHMSKAIAAAFVPEDIARPFLDGLALRIEEAERQRTGQETLEGTSAMEEQHLAGLHKRKRKACSMCFPPAPDANADPLGVGASGNGEGTYDNPEGPDDGGEGTTTDISKARRARAGGAKKSTARKRGGRKPADAF